MTVSMLEYYNGKPWLSGTHGKKLPSEQNVRAYESKDF